MVAPIASESFTDSLSAAVLYCPLSAIEQLYACTNIGCERKVRAPRIALHREGQLPTLPVMLRAPGGK